MDLLEALDKNDEKMREVKQEWVEANPDAPEMPIHIHFWRGDDHVACILTPLNGSQAIKVASLGASGFNATTMALTFESWVTTLENSPLTGKPWRQGEMNFIARTYPDAFEKGWLTEQMATSIHDREGNYYLSKHQFTVENQKVIWGDREVTPNVSPEGVPEGSEHPLKLAMDEPTMMQRITAMAGEDILVEAVLDTVIDAEERLFHCDMATLRALGEQDVVKGVFLYAEEGTERQKMIEDRADEIGLTRD